VASGENVPPAVQTFTLTAGTVVGHDSLTAFGDSVSSTGVFVG
jgi:hypothetical protein